MATIAAYNGKLYKLWYDPIRGYTKRKSLKLDDTRENRKRAKQHLKVFENYELEPVVKAINLRDVLNSYTTYKRLKPKTILIYNKAVDHFTTAAGDKYISEYNHNDYLKLLSYFRKPKKITIDRRKKKPEKFKEVYLTQNSQSLYTRHLKALFNYAIKQKMIKDNIIESIPYVEVVPRPVPSAAMDDILKSLCQREDKFQYAFIYLLVNTGMRAGTILDLHWEDINWNYGIIYFRNIKVHGTEFTFPLIPKLRAIFELIGIKNEGKIFPYKNIEALKFFRRVQEEMKFTQKYGIHKLKHTFISQAVDNGISLEDLSILTNTSLRTLKKHYYKPNMQRIGDRLQHINITNVSA